MLLRQKFTLAFLLTSIIPILLIGLITYSHISKTMEQTVLDGLHAFAESKEGELFLYLETLKITTRDFASDGFIRDKVEQLYQEPVDRKLTISLLNEHLTQSKLPLSKDLIYIDLLNLNGKVVGSNRASRTGTDNSEEIYFRKGKQGLYINDVHHHEDGTFDLEIAAPLYSRTDPERLIGVIINHFSFDSIKNLFRGKLVQDLGAKTQLRGLGKTGEVYLVNHDRQMISDSLYMEDSSFRQIVDTYPVQMSLEHNREVKGSWENYRNIKVVGASMSIQIDDFKWTLITEQAREEAFAQVHTLANYYLWIGLTIFALTLLLALLVSKNITGPINRLTSIIESFDSSKPGTQVKGIKSKDEIGILAASFNRMSESLRKAYSDIHTKNRQLEELSNRDGLTGLFNHRHLKELFQIEFNRSYRYNTPLSCLVIDIDHFKTINDTYGHLFGDVVLRGVAAAIHNTCRESDIASRYGGEEFVVILPSTNLEQATNVADKLLETISNTEHYDTKYSTSVTVSIGVSHLHDNMQSYEKMLEEADQALYQAKNSGRNRVAVFS